MSGLKRYVLNPSQENESSSIIQPGSAQNLLLEERNIPDPRKGQVLVAVKAFGLNRSELMTRKGLSPSVEFPRVLGIECAGEIISDPSGEHSPGQQVAACMGGMGRKYDGSYQEFVVLPKSVLMPFETHSFQNEVFGQDQKKGFPPFFKTDRSSGCSLPLFVLWKPPQPAVACHP